MADKDYKLWQLYEKRNAATTIADRDRIERLIDERINRIERLIEERIRRIGSGQDDAS